MFLELDLCYAVLLTTGVVVRFRFVGNDAQTGDLIVIPFGSTERVNLFTVIAGGFHAYNEIPCQ